MDLKIAQAEATGLPDFLPAEEADARYGPALTGERQTISFDREMHELRDKMVLEIETLFDVHLDDSPESLETLEEVLHQAWPEPVEDPETLEAIVANWGAYLARVILESLGGAWAFRQDLEHASLRFSRTGLETFPLHRVRQRFLLGPAYSLQAYYEQLVEELTRD